MFWNNIKNGGSTNNDGIKDMMANGKVFGGMNLSGWTAAIKL
jgi:hypothetical protein